MSKLTLDQYGYITQIQPDGTTEGGDTVNWQGQRIYLDPTQSVKNYIRDFEVVFGGWVRHIDPQLTNNGFGAFYENPWNGCISRDQFTGILAALIGRGEVWAGVRVILHHALSLFLFTYNTIRNGEDPATSKWKLPDITGPQIWAMEIRVLGKLGRFMCYPLLCLFDLALLASALRHRGTFNTLPISFLTRLFIANEFGRTPLAWLALQITPREKTFEEVTHYWGTWRENPLMIPLYMIKYDQLTGRNNVR